MKQLIRDSIIPSMKFSISEASDVDGKFILGKVKGEFFVPDGVSRNKRFYPRSLWEKIIASEPIKEKLSNKLMFGTVGHDGEVGEKGVREGTVSHAMTGIHIDENGKGIGEAIIFNTPTGQILNTLLRAGCKFRVSSRANGTFEGTKDGMPVVSEDGYELEGWDFVIEAGFLEANPKLAESLNDLQKNINNETLLITDPNGEKFMTVETKPEKTVESVLVKHIVEDNASLKMEIGKLTEELDAVKADKDLADKENADLKAEAEEKDKKLEKLAKYEEIGEPEELVAGKKEKEEKDKELEQYQELGDSPEEVKESLLSAQKHLSYIRENFGTVAEIKKALTEALTFRKEVDAIGSVKEIKESLTAFKKLVEEEEASKADAEAQALADELGLSLEEVKELLLKNSPEEIKKMYAKVAESISKKNESSRYVKKPSTTIVEKKDDKDAKIEERFGDSSRLSRINEQLSR